MSVIKSLSIGIQTNLSPLRKGLTNASTQVREWSSSIPKIAGGVAVGIGLAKTIGAGLSTIQSTIGSSLNIAINDEQLTQSFNTLIGDAGRAKATLEGLKKFGAETPFQFAEELAPAAKAMLGFGFTAEQIVPSLRQIGDISSGLGQPIQEMATIVGKIKTTDVLQGDDLLQLAERGVPIFSELGKIFDTNAEGVKELGSQGAIKFEHLQQVLNNLTGEGGQFFNMMQSQASTLGGLVSTMQDGFTALLGEVGKGIINAFDLKGLATKAIGGLEAMIPVVQSVAGWFAQFQPIIAGAVSGIESLVTKVVTTLAPPFVALAGQVAIAFGQLTSSVGGTLSTLADAGLSIAQSLIAYWSFMVPVVKQVFQTVGAIIGSFVQALGGLFSAIGGLFGGFGSSFNSIRELIVTALATIEFGFLNWRRVIELATVAGMAKVVSFANQLHYTFTTFMPEAITWFAKTSWTVITTAFANWETFLTNLFTNIAKIVTSLPDLIRGNMDFSDVWTPLETGFKEAIVDLPNISERVKGDLEKSLELQTAQLSAEVGGDLSAFVGTRLSELDALSKPATAATDFTIPKIESPTIETPAIEVPSTNVSLPEPKEQKFAALAEVGTNDARETLLRSFGGTQTNDVQTETKDIVKEQLEVQKRQLKALERQERTTTENVVAIA